MAQGRVWTGAQARERGLVDRLGGLDVAVAVAKERAGIAPDDEVELVIYPHRRSVYEAFSDQFGGSSDGVDRPCCGGLLGGARRRGPWPAPRRRCACSAAASRWR